MGTQYFVYMRSFMYVFCGQVRELEEAKKTTESTLDAARLGNQIKDEDINVLKRDKVSDYIFAFL